MPSNKQIAEIFKGLQLRFAQITHQPNISVQVFKLAANGIDICHSKSALIEQMRCETCKYWDKYIADRTDGTACCDNNLSPIYGVELPLGPDFYCCHWEEK
jgi:hypothetical protein